MNAMQFQRLDARYLDQMLAIQEICWENEPGIFVKSSCQAYARSFEFENFAVGALDGERLAGFLNCASHNRMSQMNLGRYLGYSPQMLDAVGHLNTVLMHPDYRGRGLAKHLVELAKLEFPAHTRYLMATTAPENTTAQRILRDFGFERQGGQLTIGGQARLLFVHDRYEKKAAQP